MTIRTRYLPIEKAGIKRQPDFFTVTLGDSSFSFKIAYNPIEEFFTANIWKDNELLTYGRKIVYDVDILEGLNQDFKIIPLSPSGVTEINLKTFNDSVKLYIIENGDN